jgi:hypothetical protein
MIDLCPIVKWSSTQIASEYRTNLCGFQIQSISLAYVMWSVFEWLKTRWSIVPFDTKCVRKMTIGIQDCLVFRW